jgi:hypothetical protein
MNDLPRDGHHSPTPNIDSDLWNKINALMDLVLPLEDSVNTLPFVGPTSDNVNLLVSIGQVTKNLLVATTASDVVTSLEHLVALSSISVRILEDCDCVDALRLQHLHSNLKLIPGVSLEALTWCHNHPVVPGSNTPPLNAGRNVVVGSSDRLNLFTLELLRPIKATATFSGGNTANALVDSVVVDPGNEKRNFDVRHLVDSDLLSCLEVLVDLVAKLHVSVTLTLSTSQTCVGPAELALVKEMVDSLTCITPSTTLAGLRISVNRMLVAESSLGKALQTCSDAGTAKDLVGLLVKVTLKLGDLCGPSKTIVHQSTGSLLPTSRRVIVTSRLPSRSPTTTTPFSVTVGLPITTTAAVPASSDEVTLSLNNLLSGLGLGQVKSVITV